MFRRTFCVYETSAFGNFSLVRDYLADVFFYPLFWGLHSAHCKSLYARVSVIHHTKGGLECTESAFLIVALCFGEIC